MDLLMNGLLMAATLFAGGYCWVLARRVQDLKSLDRGLGGSIVTLTRQVELARLTLEEARTASKDTRQDLSHLVSKADAAANQLKLLIAAAPVPAPPTAEPAPVPRVAEPAPAPWVAEAAMPVAIPQLAIAALQPVPEAVMPVAMPQLAIAALEPVPEAVARPAAPHLAEVPKPRTLVPIENPLRRAKTAAGGPVRSEDEILEALSALAGSGGR